MSEEVRTVIWELLIYVFTVCACLSTLSLIDIALRLRDMVEELKGVKDGLRANRNATALRNVQNRRTE